MWIVYFHPTISLEEAQHFTENIPDAQLVWHRRCIISEHGEIEPSCTQHPLVYKIQKTTSPYPLISRHFEISPKPFLTHGTFTWIAGPCSVESKGMIQETAHFLSSLGVFWLRGGCFKARSSPYPFQGYGQAALQDLRDAADQFGMKIITEVISEELVSPLSEIADILQVGSRNAQNFQLLRKLGKQPKPVLLKRGFMNTIDEFLLAAEYIAMNGNDQIILCERGIRTFETATRNTLDIAALPLIQQASYLPIIIDPSHAAGRTDIILPLIQAGLVVHAAGAMVEVHPCPAAAKVDGKQSLSFQQFEQVFHSIQDLARRIEIKIMGRAL